MRVRYKCVTLMARVMPCFSALTEAFATTSMNRENELSRLTRRLCADNKLFNELSETERHNLGLRRLKLCLADKVPYVACQHGNACVSLLICTSFCIRLGS